MVAQRLIDLSFDELGGSLVRFTARDLGLIDLRGRFHRFAPSRARLRFAPDPARTDSK